MAISAVREFDWDSLSFMRWKRMSESVKTGMMSFRRFRITSVKGCSVVDGEIHEQTFMRGFNRHRRIAMAVPPEQRN